MAYGEKIINHYEHPRNVGNFGTQAEVKTRKDVGVGLVGAPECGDVMQLQIKVNQDNRRDRGRQVQVLRLRLRDRFVVAGDRVAQVAGRWMRASRSRTPRSSKNSPLPPVKIHCSVLAEDAIRSAIADYKQKNGLAAEQHETAKAH